MGTIGSQRLWIFSGLGIVLLSSILAGYVLLSSPASITVSSEGEIHPIATSFTYTEFFKEKTRKKIVAQALVIKPRPLLFFNVKGIREAMLVDAQIDIYSYDDTSSSQVELFPFTRQQAMPIGGAKALLEQYGPITRLVIEGLVLKIHDNADLRLAVSAKRAIQQGKDSPWLLEGAMLWCPKTSKRIYSDQIFWYQQDQFFKFPKRALLLTADGQRQEQKPTQLNLDLESVPP